jgi:hypothetical protein
LNKQEFISLIEHPETLGKKNIPALKNIAADFPYFQNVQLLLTKALHNEKHYEFEKQLKYTALMVPDRSVLFNYIYHTSVVDTPGIKPSENVQDPVIAAISEIDTPFALQLNESVVLPEPIIEPIVDVDSSPVEEFVEPSINEPEATKLAVEIIEPISSVTKQEEITLADVSPTPILNNEEHSFAEWLKAISAGTQSMVNTPISEAEKIQTLSSIPPDTNTKPQPSNVPQFESVLDKFLRENPRMSRPKAEFYNPVNMAKQSVAENDEFVTETLANVYYKQGHLKKAIKAYEKLCLIYPHKMSYFAGLIQKIKTENKD